MLRKSTLICMLFVILILSMLPLVAPASASPETVLRLMPSSIVDESLTPCKNITLTLEVVNVTNLYGYEIKIFYDRTVLKATQAVRPPGHFLEPVDPTKLFQVAWQINNDFNTTHGRIYLALTLLAPEPAKSGSGTLAQITFHIETTGSTPITLKDSILADNNSNPILHTTQNSYFSNTPPPPPPPPAEIYINPQELIDESLVPSHNFTVDIAIINATDVFAFNFKLTYNPAIVEVLDIKEATFLSNVGPTSVLITDINNTAGYVHFAVSLQSPPGANGDGTLATITFHILGMGATLLSLDETILLDSTSEPLSHTVKHGYFSNIIFATLFVYPPEIIDPSILPGDIFSIDIKIDNVKNLYGYKFHLNYDQTVLTCIGVYIHPALNETNFSSSFSVNDGIGHVQVNVTYYPPAKPLSTIPPISLVTLIFKVDRMGVSNLTLYDTQLIDPEGNQIPHQTKSGFFQSVTRDVAVIHVAPHVSTVYEGWTVNITVIVRNKGDVPETFNVTAYYDITPIETQTVTNLAPGENLTLTFKWKTKGLEPCHNYIIKAEAKPVPYETNLADNMFVDGAVKIKMMGDINGDGVVNILDVSAVALAFGSRPGDPNWNPDADLDQNGIINILDLVQVTLNYGKTC